MSKITTFLAVLLISSFTWAESNSAPQDGTKPAPHAMDDHNKMLELCKSMNVKMDCAKAAHACGGVKNKKECMEQQAKK